MRFVFRVFFFDCLRRRGVGVGDERRCRRRMWLLVRAVVVAIIIADGREKLRGNGLVGYRG
jgi:hypothetical protein